MKKSSGAILFTYLKISVLVVSAMVVNFSCAKVVNSDPSKNCFEVLFADFNQNIEKIYANQNYLGAELGNVISDIDDDGVGDTIIWGGGQWYAYASGYGDGDSACVYSFDTLGLNDTIVTLAALKPKNPEIDPLKMFGDDSLTIVLDAKDAAEDNEPNSFYYAAIGCAIAGDPEHLNGVVGYKRIEAKDPGAGLKVDCITWDLSNLLSVTIRGRCSGAFKFNFTGVKSDSTIGVVSASLSSPDPVNEEKPVPLDITVPMTLFVKADWNGTDWANIKGNCHQIAIELNTEAQSGGDLVHLKLDEIKFNFSSEENAKAAFPFLAN